MTWTRKVYAAARPGATDPVLAASEIPWGLVAAPALGEQHAMNFPEQPQRQRQSFIQQAQAVVESGDIVADLLVYRLFRKRKR